MTASERIGALREARLELAESISLPDCVVCDDRGCEWCGKVPEPWPAETFTLLGVTDLEQLVRDIDEELERRRLA